MIDGLLDHIAPHLCSGCTKSRTILCEKCKYDIISEPYNRCLICTRPTGVRGLCHTCIAPYSRAWYVSERTDTLKALINAYKFERAKAAHRSLGVLLHEVLPELPVETIIVLVPTIADHVRERGYDYSLLISRYIASRRRLDHATILRRQTNSKQRGAVRAARLAQAKQAFTVSGSIEPDRPYLLIDDIVTTGATVHYTAQRLYDASASEVWVAVIARQPLD